MSARIIAQIDALLARLTAARQLLASTLTNTEAEVQPGRVVTMEAREPVEVAADVSATPVQVTVLKPRGPRERRTITRKRSSAPVAAALAGHIPQHPVAVSRQQLADARESRAAEQPNDAARAGGRSALDELVLEVTQRSA